MKKYIGSLPNMTSIFYDLCVYDDLFTKIVNFMKATYVPENMLMNLAKITDSNLNAKLILPNPISKFQNQAYYVVLRNLRD